MNRFLTMLLGTFFCLPLMASNPGGGGINAPDTCQAVSLDGKQYTFVFTDGDKSNVRDFNDRRAPNKAPHVVGETIKDKLRYSIFDFDEGNGYVATLIGWVDSYDYYENIVVPNTVKYDGQDVPVTTINNYAFCNGWGIKSVTIGNNVIAICKNAFYSCSITDLYIPISVIWIQKCAFMYNPLESVKFQKPNQTMPPLQIDIFAFACLRIKEFELPARLSPYSLILDRGNPLALNPYLSTISINPATGSWGAPSREPVDESEYCAFEIINDALCVVSGTGDNRRVAIVAYPGGNTKESFELSENLIDVNNAAFGQTSLRSIKFKATAPANQNETKISVYGSAFGYNSELEKLSFEASGDVQLPSGMATGCGNLESIDIGDGITNYSVDDDVIYQTIDGELTLVNYPSGKKDNIFDIPEGVTCISSNAMSQNEYVREVNMPHGMINIGELAFVNCSQLRQVNLPSTLQVISSEAFYGCRLENITIPASVTHIDEQAFYSDRSVINSVNVLCDTPPVSSSGEVASEIFSEETLESATLTLPDNVDYTVFTSHPAWAFKNVQSAGIDNIEADTNQGFRIDGNTVTSISESPIELIGVDGSIISFGLTVTVPSPGIYFIRQNDKTYKVAIR